MINNGVDEADANNICTENKVLKYISKCQESHNGPITSIESLHKLVGERSSEENEKEIHKCLNLEIRFRKYTLNEVKKTCPLFRQKGLSVQQKVKNLEALIDSQLAFKALASMDDLELAINDTSTQDASLMEVDVDELLEDNDGIDLVGMKTAVQHEEISSQSSSVDQFKIDDYILVLFEGKEGACPCRIREIKGKMIKVHCLHPIEQGGKKNFRYWNWPSLTEKQDITSECVLPIRPTLGISKQHTSRRHVVFELENYDLVKMFV